jgi:ferredoxin-thioredoxin reductase catalytic chain
LTAAGADASDDKSLEVMRKFSEQYARRSNTFFCADKTVTAVVIKVSTLRISGSVYWL